MTAEWPTLALFWYAPHGASSARDPIFARRSASSCSPSPRGTSSLAGCLRWPIIVCILAALFLLITSGSRALDKRRGVYGSSPWRGSVRRSRIPSAYPRDRSSISTASTDCSTATPSSKESPTPTRISRSVACCSSVQPLILGAVLAARQCRHAVRAADGSSRQFFPPRSAIVAPRRRRLVRRQLHRQAQRTRSRSSPTSPTTSR